MGGGCDCNDSAEIRKLRQEIAAIKLDKALNLTAAQAKTLSELSGKAQSMKADIDKARKKAEPSFVKALTALRDELKKTGEISPETARRVRLARGEVDFRELQAGFDALAGQALAVLTDEQKAILFGFGLKPLAPWEPRPQDRWNAASNSAGSVFSPRPPRFAQFPSFIAGRMR